MSHRQRLLMVLMAVGLILLGVAFPSFLTPNDIGLLDAVRTAEETRQANPLLLASVLVVLLNTVRALPHYIGVFLLCEALLDVVKPRWLSALLPMLILPGVYKLINLYTPIKYHFGGPAVMLVVAIIFLNRMERGAAGIGAKVLILGQFLLAVEWLDMVKWLTPYGFGLGPVSFKIKQLAESNGVDFGLSMFALLLCLFLLLSVGISVLLTRMFNQTVRERNRVHQVQLKMAEARSGQEVLFLVHDLKTPLTSIGGLSSLINMRVDDEKVRTYSQKIEQSITVMSEMISEILFADRKKLVSVQEILDTVTSSRFSGSPDVLTVEVREPMPLLYVNKIRIVRALINLLNNAFDAVAGLPHGSVRLLVERSQSEVHFSVVDNGTGIPQEDLENIWNLGYSTKDSAGAGLAFVRQVVKAHGGRTAVRSTKGEGTVVTVILPGGAEPDGKDSDRR
ncbi:sensor histidine kinase [Effusibacillus pohliae]|uniref:sensor histidine kinase n=1 Tax=Effusibacillus pohliae TaxID=232270 RepID=UPI000368E6E4|nr:HAMP domain-containing sensor histidine kinase [Effusibacillus pohliae]